MNMDVHKDPTQVSNGFSKEATTASTFGNQSTGFSAGFGRQTNTVFGTFANQKNQQNANNNLTSFGSQQNSFYNNQAFFQPHHFGFGRAMSNQTTNICFTGFGEPKSNFLFNSPSSTTNVNKVTLIFENPDMVFGSSVFKKPNIIVEIEALPINNRSWLSNDFSFGVDYVEKYNSMFTMKSARPLKFLVKVQNSTTIVSNMMASSINNGNKKITFTFRSNQPQFQSNTRQMETIVEIPLPYNNLMSNYSNEDFMVSVGPDANNNSFEVQNSKNCVFKITFAETGRYLFGNNRQTNTGSVFFDQGRQMNAFPRTSGSLFGNQTAMGTTHQSLGSMANGNACVPFNQAQPINSNQTNSGSLFGKPLSTSHAFGAPAGFDAIQSFGNSTVGAVGIGAEKIDKSCSTTGGFSFGQTNDCIESRKAFGSETCGISAFDQVKSVPKPQPAPAFYDKGLTDLNCSQALCNNQSSMDNSEECEFGAKQPTTSEDKLKSVHYKPTFGSDIGANCLGAVQTKTNCITAMNEYANKSLEEIRLNDYLRIQSNPTTETPAKKQEETASNSNANTITAYSPSQNMIGNTTNQAFFDQLHQLIPYLNAGSFCKCNRSCNSFKNQSNTQTLANNQPRSKSDSLDHLYVNTQKSRLNDNITIDEFYNDVFKYLEYIQKQYRHLESTLNNKNENKTSENSSNKSARRENTEETPNKKTHKSPHMSVFGSSTYSACKIPLNENNSSINPISADKTVIVEEPSEANKSLLFGNKIKSFETTTAGISDKSTKVNDKEARQTEDNSKKTDEILNPGETNKISIEHSQTIPMSLFGTSIYSAANTTSLLATTSGAEKITPTAVANKPNVFGSSMDSASALREFTSQIKVKPAKCLSFFSGFDNNIGFGTSKPVDFSFSGGTGKSSDAAQTNEISTTLGDPSNSVKTSTSNIFSSTATSNSTGPFFGTKNTTSNNRVEENPKSICSIGFSGDRPIRIAVPRKIPDCISTNSSFSGIKSSKSDNITTGSIFVCESNSKDLDKQTASIFSSPIKMPGNTFSAPSFSTKDSIFSSTAGQTSTGFFSFNIVSSKSANIFANTNSIGSGSDNLPSIFSMNDSSIKSDNIREDKGVSDVAESSYGEGHSAGGINIVKAVNSLKSIISNDNKAEEEPSTKEKSSSNKQTNKPMDVKDGLASSSVFKMKKISDILADINDKEENLEKSLSKSESDSDISNYSLLSNRSSGYDKEEHPTGIVMTRYGYYILPSRDDLKSKITEDGACLASNFTIGRKGYGCICFNKEINVAGLNIDNIVHFRNKEIIIYPNEHTNPQVVDDLKNSDVLVTLEQIWPHDDVKHEPIKDPQQLDKLKYEDKLRLVCYKNDVHFVDYRPETGSWLFKMKKFNKVNINCWDVEDEDILEQKNSPGIPKIIKLKRQSRRSRTASRILFIAKRKAMFRHVR